MARMEMGLSSDEFWSLTIPEWNALLQAHKRKVYGDRFILASFYANWLNAHTDKKKSKAKAITPQDLLPKIEEKSNRDWKKDREDAFRRAREEDERCGVKR